MSDHSNEVASSPWTHVQFETSIVSERFCDGSAFSAEDLSIRTGMQQKESRRRESPLGRGYGIVCNI